MRVYRNQVDHRKPVPGDHGIHWESNGRPFPEEVFRINKKLSEEANDDGREEAGAEDD